MRNAAVQWGSDMGIAQRLKELGAYELLRERVGNDLEGWWETSTYGGDMLWVADKFGVQRELRVRAALECARIVLPAIPSWEADAFECYRYALAWTAGGASLVRVSEACERLWHRTAYWTESLTESWDFATAKQCPWYYAGNIVLSAAWSCEHGHTSSVPSEIRNYLGDAPHEYRLQSVKDRHHEVFPRLPYPWCRVPSVDEETAAIVRAWIPMESIKELVQ